MTASCWTLWCLGVTTQRYNPPRYLRRLRADGEGVEGQRGQETIRQLRSEIRSTVPRITTLRITNAQDPYRHIAARLGSKGKRDRTH